MPSNYDSSLDFGRSKVSFYLVHTLLIRRIHGIAFYKNILLSLYALTDVCTQYCAVPRLVNR